MDITIDMINNAESQSDLSQLEEKRKAEIAKATKPKEYWWRCGRCGHVQPDSYDEGCDNCGVGNEYLVSWEKKINYEQHR